MKMLWKVFFFAFAFVAASCVPQEGRQLFSFRQPDDQRIRPCTTPDGSPGLCQDVTNCPQLLLDLSTLVRSICFQSLFRPGTCCPVKNSVDILKRSTTEEPTITSTTTETTTTTTATSTTTPATTQTTTPTTTTTTTTTTTPTTTTTTTTTPTTTTTTLSTTVKPGLETGLRPPPLLLFPSVHPSPPETVDRPYNKRFECGVSVATQARIVNGSESYPGQWPWMAAVYLHGFLGSDFHCGGTVLSKQYVVTAAHCMIDKRGQRFSPSQLSVRLGDHDISTKNANEDKFAKTFRVESIIVHPEFENFNHQYFTNDIALLKLSKPIEFSPFILPVCLPSISMSRAPIDSLSGQISTVIGYGRTSYSGPQSKRLLKAEMPVWWNQACNDAYFPPILDTNICAGYVEGGIDSCQGDSGGPLLIPKNGKWVILGIVSFGQKCAEPGYPGVYTRIPKFVEWVRKNAQ